MIYKSNPKQCTRGRRPAVDIHSRSFKNMFHEYIKRIRRGQTVRGLYNRFGCKRTTFLAIIERHSKLYQITNKVRMERSRVHMHRLLKGIQLYIHRRELGLGPEEIVSQSHINYGVLCTKAHEYQRSGGNIMAILPINRAYVKSYVAQLKKKITKQDHEISKLKHELNSREEDLHA